MGQCFSDIGLPPMLLKVFLLLYLQMNEQVGGENYTLLEKLDADQRSGLPRSECELIPVKEERKPEYLWRKEI
jgi:hypothetical protein